MTTPMISRLCCSARWSKIVSRTLRTRTYFTGRRKLKFVGGNHFQKACRQFSSDRGKGNLDMAMYLVGVAVAGLGLSYAAVPLYQAFCQATGYGGTVQISQNKKLEGLASTTKGERKLTIKFDAMTGIGMPWSFKPLQTEIQLNSGETVLAFYNAENPTDRAMTGVATYNVIPMKAGLYFNKVQCFCFHEQKLLPKENIDMPVFFFIDNEFELDKRMDDVNEITLAYTFFPIDDEEEPNDTEDD